MFYLGWHCSAVEELEFFRALERHFIFSKSVSSRIEQVNEYCRSTISNMPAIPWQCCLVSWAVIHVPREVLTLAAARHASIATANGKHVTSSSSSMKSEPDMAIGSMVWFPRRAEPGTFRKTLGRGALPALCQRRCSMGRQEKKTCRYRPNRHPVGSERHKGMRLDEGLVSCMAAADGKLPPLRGVGYQL